METNKDSQEELGDQIPSQFCIDQIHPPSLYCPCLTPRQPSSTHESLYVRQPSSTHESLYDRQPSSAHESLYDRQPSSTHESLYDRQPSSAHDSLYDRQPSSAQDSLFVSHSIYGPYTSLPSRQHKCSTPQYSTNQPTTSHIASTTDDSSQNNINQGRTESASSSLTTFPDSKETDAATELCLVECSAPDVGVTETSFKNAYNIANRRGLNSTSHELRTYHQKKRSMEHVQSVSADFPVGPPTGATQRQPSPPRCQDDTQYQSYPVTDRRITRKSSGPSEDECKQKIRPSLSQGSIFLESLWEADQRPTADPDLSSVGVSCHRALLESALYDLLEEQLNLTGNDDAEQKKRLRDTQGRIFTQSPETPAEGISQISASALAAPVTRTVSQDYPIPSWMTRKKVFSNGYRCPYRYSKTFIGTHGVVNYDFEGDLNDSIILCFHGLNATRLTFHEFQNVLSLYKYCVISFDLYGHGLSSSPQNKQLCSPFLCRSPGEPPPYSLDFYIQQTEELLEHLCITDRQLSLCGFSMGGVIAAGYAAKHSDKVERLMLISSAGMISKHKPLPVQLLRCCYCCIPCIPKFICRCCCSRRRYMRKLRKEEIDSGLGEALWSRLMWQLFVKKGVVEAFLGSVANLPMWSAENIFRKVGESKIPVLLLWGEEDQVAPISSAPSVLECFPNGHLIVFERSTHLLLTDQAQAVIALALTFFDFPKSCVMKKWRFLLPFDHRGLYVPTENRHPVDFTVKTYWKQLQFRPRLIVKLPQPDATPKSSSPRHQSIHSNSV